MALFFDDSSNQLTVTLLDAASNKSTNDNVVHLLVLLPHALLLVIIMPLVLMSLTLAQLAVLIGIGLVLLPIGVMSRHLLITAQNTRASTPYHANTALYVLLIMLQNYNFSTRSSGN